MENNKQQTAVESIINQLRQLAHNPSTHLGMGDVRVTQGMIDELEEQAKQMEKEQLENVMKEIADEDIKRKIKKEYNYTHYEDRLWMVQGAVWYKEQLKKK